MRSLLMLFSTVENAKDGERRMWWRGEREEAALLRLISFVRPSRTADQETGREAVMNQTSWSLMRGERNDEGSSLIHSIYVM